MKNIETSRNKILIIGAHGGRSGVPRYIAHLADTLSPQNSVEIVCDTDEGAFAANHSDIRVNEAPGLASNLNPFSIFRAGKRLAHILSTSQPDIIWANSTIPILLARLLFTFRIAPSHRLIVTYHGMPYGPGRKPGLSVLLRIVEWLGLCFSRRHELVFISNKDHTLCPSILTQRHRVWHVTNSSNLQATHKAVLPNPETPLRIKVIARVSYQKNILAAADVFANMSDHCCLELIGKGTNTEAFERAFLARVPKALRSRIKFSGECTDIPSLLSRTDVLLLTSRYEGMPIVALEALQAGVPVAAPDIGGAEEFSAATRFFINIDLSTKTALCRSADTIVKFAHLYRSDIFSYQREIQAAWRANFSSDVWSQSVKDIIRSAHPAVVEPLTPRQNPKPSTPTQGKAA